MKIVTLYIGHDGVEPTIRPGTDEKHTVEDTVVTEVDTALMRIGVDGYTLTSGTGMWEGEAEPCTVVTIVLDGNGNFNETNLIRNATRSLRTALSQQAILMTVQDATAEMIQ